MDNGEGIVGGANISTLSSILFVSGLKNSDNASSPRDFCRPFSRNFILTRSSRRAALAYLCIFSMLYVVVISYDIDAMTHLHVYFIAVRCF